MAADEKAMIYMFPLFHVYSRNFAIYEIIIF